MLSGRAPSRASPLLQWIAPPVGAGLPAKRPVASAKYSASVKAIGNLSIWQIFNHPPRAHHSPMNTLSAFYQNLGLALSLLVIGTFVLAGMIKGVIGLGLPTVAMGLLGLALAPSQAAALLIIPATLT